MNDTEISLGLKLARETVNKVIVTDLITKKIRSEILTCVAGSLLCVAMSGDENPLHSVVASIAVVVDALVFAHAKRGLDRNTVATIAEVTADLVHRAFQRLPAPYNQMGTAAVAGALVAMTVNRAPDRAAMVETLKMAIALGLAIPPGTAIKAQV